MGTPFAVSPDGRRIAFSGSAGGTVEPVALVGRGRPGHGGSRTGRWHLALLLARRARVAFFAGDDLRRVPVDGGPATTIAAAPVAARERGAASGTILFTRSVGAGRRDLLGSGPRRRAPADRAGLVPARAPGLRSLPPRRPPLPLPEGFRSARRRPAALRRLRSTAGEPDCFASCQSQAEYSGSGHVLCVRAGTLVALPFDARSRKPTGEAVTVGAGRPLVRPERLRVLRGLGRRDDARPRAAARGLAPRLARPERPRDGRGGRAGRSRPAAARARWPSGRGGRRCSPTGSGRDLWSLDTGSGVASRLTFQSIDASAAHLVAGRHEPRLREGRGRAPRRHRAPSRRDGTRRGAPARPGRPAPEALVSRRPLHRLRGLLCGPARPATALAALTRRKGPSASPRRRRAATTAASRPTGGGSPTSRRNRAGRRSTSLRCGVARRGGSRARAACCRVGGATGRSSSSSSRTA